MGVPGAALCGGRQDGLAAARQRFGSLFQPQLIRSGLDVALEFPFLDIAHRTSVLAKLLELLCLELAQAWMFFLHVGPTGVGWGMEARVSAVRHGLSRTAPHL
jgi:hypothetical protein